VLGPKNLNRIVAQSIHTPNGHVPLYLEDHFAHKEGSGFCPLDRADGVNPGFVLREKRRAWWWLSRSTKRLFMKHSIKKVRAYSSRLFCQNVGFDQGAPQKIKKHPQYVRTYISF
jgi:hypothetical protein